MSNVLIAIRKFTYALPLSENKIFAHISAIMKHKSKESLSLVKYVVHYIIAPCHKLNGEEAIIAATNVRAKHRVFYRVALIAIHGRVELARRITA